MSAPAANTFSPPYRITARMPAELPASAAAAASSAVTWSFSALTGGRSSRIVPMPSAVSSRTNSAMPVPFPPRQRRSPLVMPAGACG